MSHPRALIALAVLVVPAMLGAVPAAAHGPVHEQIRELSAAIARAPSAAELRLRRGRAYLAAGHPQDAARDLRRALALDPQLRGAYYFLAEAELAAGRAAAASRAVGLFLTSLQVDHGEAAVEIEGGRFRGLLLLGRALSATSQYSEAATAYGDALALGVHARPEDYLAHAQALESAQRPAEALAALEVGLQGLGSVITLEQRALALELVLGRTDAALDRLERMISASPQPAALCYQRGELLESLGRTVAARDSYRAGLAALARLPPARLRAPALSELHARLQAAQAP